MLAKLELHHDHLRDWIGPHSRELFGGDWLEKIPKSSIILIDYIRELTSRFDLCLLCSECNAADGKVKSCFRAEIDSKFSYTAQEVGQFVRAHVGQDHDIDYTKALNIWEAERSSFLARLALIDDLLVQLVCGRLARDYQGISHARGVSSAFDPLTILARSFYRETRDTERALLLKDYRQEFLARSTQRDSVKLLPSIGCKRAVAPTDEEYTAYVDPVSGKSWQAVPEDWICPVCERGKRQLLRKSKAGKWTGGVRSHYECALETDRPSLRSGVVFFLIFETISL